MELGRRMGGWWLGGSGGSRRVAVGRIKGRCSFELSRDGGVRGIGGGWAAGGGDGGSSERAREDRMVHAVRPRGRAPRSRGGSDRAGDAGRRVAVVDGWRCSTWVEATTSKSDFRSTCYASASSTLGKLPFAAALSPSLTVSLRPLLPHCSPLCDTHNSRALFISPSRTPVTCTGRRRCGVSTTSAYFALTVARYIPLVGAPRIPQPAPNGPKLRRPYFRCDISR